MRGLTFTVIASVVLAIFGVLVLLLILDALAPGFMGDSMCRFYMGVNLLPLPPQVKPALPGYCSIVPETERLEMADITPGVLADFAIRCWNKADIGMAGQTFICYELFVRYVPTPVSESDANNEINRRGYGGKLPPEKINWRIGLISGQDVTIILKYNASMQALEVI